jgi:AcrR family transcriptional regulator
MPAKTERRHRQGNESRQRILEAAIAIAVERGYDGTTVALVTERAGLPASSVYWQFANKDELIAAALDHSYRRWRTEGPTWQAANYSGTSRERIHTRLGHSLNSVERELDYWRLGLTLAMLRRSGGIAAQDRFVAVRGETRRIIHEWWSSLDLDVAERQPALMRNLTALYLAFVDGMFVAHRADPDIDLTLLQDVVGDALADVYEVRAAAGAPVRRRAARRRRRKPAVVPDDDSRTKLLDAAAEIAAERGYRGTTISRICARAGVPVSSVYWFFTDKDELLSEVVGHSWEEWFAGQPSWVPPAPGTAWTDTLTTILDGAVTSLTDAPSFLRIGHMLTLEQPPGEIAARDRFLDIRRGIEDRICAWFADSLPADAVAREPRLPRALAVTLIAFTDGYFLGVQIDSSEPPVTEFVDLVVDVLAQATARYTPQGD